MLHEQLILGDHLASPRIQVEVFQLANFSEPAGFFQQTG
jgi:hypothetical protein